MVGLTENPKPQDTGSPRRAKRWLRILRRILVGTVLALVGLVLLLAVVFLFAPTRTAVLGWGLGIADDALPGTLTAGKVGWPSVGHLVFDDVLWISGSAAAPGDTLADLAKLDLTLDLRALKNRDGRIKALFLDVRNLDVPAIALATADTSASVVPDSLTPVTEPAGSSFLQAGSLPGIPSIAVNKLNLKVDRAQLAPDFSIRELELSGRADAGPERPATAVIDHVGARLVTAVVDTAGVQEWEIVLQHLDLGVNLKFLSSMAGVWTLASASLDNLNLVLAPVATRDPKDIWRTTEPVGLNAVAAITRQGREYRGQFEGDFVLPGSAHFQPWLPSDFPHEEFGAATGRLTLDGTYSAPRATAQLRLDLGSNTWLDHGVVAGHAQADIDSLKAFGPRVLTAHLDTLDIGLEGIDVISFGQWSSGDFDLALATSLTNTRLIGLFAAGLDPTLDELLRDPGSVTLAADVAVGRTGEELSGRLDCDFALPGASQFQRFLPDDFPHEDFESLVGNLAAAGSWADPMANGSVRLDLAENSWAEKGVVSVQAEANLDSLKSGNLRYLTARLDTLDVHLEDLRIQASGGWRSGDFDLDAVTSLTGIQLVGLFASGFDPVLDDLLKDPGPVSLNADVSVGRTGPELSGRLEGDFALPGASHFQRFLPDDFPHEDFESLIGDFAVAGTWADPVASGEVRLDLGENNWAEKGLVAATAEANLDSLKAGGLRYLTARLEKLEVAMEGLRIQASGALDPQSVDLDLDAEVTDFRIPGLFAGPDLADVELDLQIDAIVGGSLEEPEVNARAGGSFLQEKISIPSFDFSIAGDRQNLAARLAAGGGLRFEETTLDSVRAQVQGEIAGLDSLTAGFGVAVWREKGHLALGGSVSGDTVRVVRLDSLVTIYSGKQLRTTGPAVLTLGPGAGVFDLSELDMVGDPGTIHLRGFWNEISRDLDAGIDLLVSEEMLQQVYPSPLWSLNGGVDLKLDASAELEGEESDTRVDGRASAVLVPHRNDPPFGIGMEFTSTGGAKAVLNAFFEISSADTSFLKAKLVWPGKAGPENGFWNPDPERSLVLTVPSQKMDLRRINSRLPDEVVLNGVFDIAAEAHVFPPDQGGTQEKPPSSLLPKGRVEGTLSSPDLRIDLPNRSYLNTVFDAKVTGPIADPKVAAKLRVDSGFIRIPEIPRNLHQVEGISLLWALNDSLEALGDSLVTDDLWTEPPAGHRDSLQVFLRPELEGPAVDPTLPPFLPELDIEVVISDKLRIIGYGADFKLGGQLKISRGFDEDGVPGPAITGNITIPEGTVKVMNRVFDVERGNVKFNKSVPSNPDLDLMMETQVNAYLLRVLVSGRAAAPVIQLTSEPDLTEEDVMAVLLFGQPMSDLDGDQRGRMEEENDPSRELQKNLAGLAMAFGTRGLQDSMSDSFGVDVVSMGSDSSGASTLMVGKFITPDILLKYNQSLENSGTYFMTLEYSLNRYFKIVSTYGQGEEASGAELKWSKRY